MATRRHSPVARSLDPRERAESDYLRDNVRDIVAYWQRHWSELNPGALIVAYVDLARADDYFFADLEALRRTWSDPRHPAQWATYAEYLISQANEWDIPVISLHPDGIHAHMWYTGQALAWLN